MEHFVEFEDVCKYYQTGSVKIAAADHLNFYVDKGEFCIIVGPSGAGKTTLLNILGGMDSCDEGNVWLDGQNVSHFTARELTTYRRYDVGFVFQFYNLVQNLTALENVELASEICRDPLDPKETLRSVGLGERLNNFPAQLSGGEHVKMKAAARVHCPRTGQKPQAAALRRAHRCTGLQDRQAGAGPFAGYLPPHRPHGDRYYPQHRPDSDGRPHHSGAQRQDRLQSGQRAPCAGAGD